MADNGLRAQERTAASDARSSRVSSPRGSQTL
jgi:hypothetical protein